MQITITARHLKLTTAIRDYVEKKLEKANRFLDPLIWAQVVLDVSKPAPLGGNHHSRCRSYLHVERRVDRSLCGDRFCFRYDG